MSREHIALLLLYAVLACAACGERGAKKDDSSSRERAFQNKRICAEVGSQRLALDRRKREAESEGVTHDVEAEWCFSTDLNTCIYSSIDKVVVTFDPNSVPGIMPGDVRTIDLLTNRTLISVDPGKARRVELEEYEKKRRELFGKCQ
jgi:hypothetical protein